MIKSTHWRGKLTEKAAGAEDTARERGRLQRTPLHSPPRSRKKTSNLLSDYVEEKESLQILRMFRADYSPTVKAVLFVLLCIFSIFPKPYVTVDLKDGHSMTGYIVNYNKDSLFLQKDTSSISFPISYLEIENVTIGRNRLASTVDSAKISQLLVSRANDSSAVSHSFLREVRVPRKSEIIPGSCLFGTFYTLALYVAISNTPIYVGTGSNSNPAGFFAIPVVGPLVALIASPPLSGSPEGELDFSGADVPICWFFGILWTVAESVGAFMIIHGTIGKLEQQAVLNSPVMVEPIVTRDRVGVNLSFWLDNFHHK
jgi:hypothetical protein